MKKIAISILSLLWISILAATPASAVGFGFGGTASYIQVEADGKETDQGDTSDYSVRTKSVTNDAVIGSLYLELTAGENNGFALGFEHTPGSADVSDKTHTRTDTETSVSGDATANSDSREFKAAAEIENFNVTYIEVPFRNLYFRYGISELDVNTQETASSNGGSYPNATIDGQQYGIGFKGIRGNSLRWKVGYEMNDFDGLSIDSTGNSTDSSANRLTADLDTWSFKLALGYQF